ncbi:hypothetical protein SS50377_20141 [Spironucleus salmonicida]|uniref:Uncharacterized protein n=1 Tax=Spironucleus salmonicida TaxID=348837 RepID=V6LNA8_9EUKA|nr:hypothetical protein SS50377_20141 [Spironucleus salmonicida]|eukprot:EST45196.1 Hypothetical protein SS50377_jh063 [Spironucleus salmonicida]
MPLKTKQIETFLSDYFSDLKLTLQPENMKLYECFKGEVPLEEIIQIPYFSKHHVTLVQLIKAVNLSKIVQLSLCQSFITRVNQIKNENSLISQTLLISSMESSYIPTINKDIKWFIAKQTNIFPKFTQVIKTRVFGEAKFIAKLSFASREEAYKVYEFFGSQPSWDRGKIIEQTAFFSSKTWGKSRVLGDNNYVERMLSCKAEINKNLIVLRMDDLKNSFPKNCVVSAKIENGTKELLMKWFCQICQFVFCEYLDGVFVVVCRDSPACVSLLHCKHMFNEKLVEFQVVQGDEEERLWGIVMSHEFEKGRL